MKPFEWNNGRLRFLDQTKLPLEVTFCETEDVLRVAEAIRCLAVRGAPLIGIAAAYGVALASRSIPSTAAGDVFSHILSAIDLLAGTRPTAVNLFWALERQRKVLDVWKNAPLSDIQNKLLEEAICIHQEDEHMCERISTAGAGLLLKKSSILTHCNAGMCATGGRGTAIGIITKAWEQGKILHVYIDETRPLFQGARITAWEMKQAKIPATLIIDSAAALLMRQKKIHAVIVGADRIAKNGDTANKVGTYSLAVNAKHHGIPFYVAAPLSTFDVSAKTGDDICIEERNTAEITKPFGVKIVPDEINVYAPAFDITPSEFITAIITDQGIFRQPMSRSLKQFLME